MPEYVQLPQLNTQGPNVLGIYQLAEQIKNQRNQSRLAEMANTRSEKQMAMNEEQHAEDLKLKQSNAIVSIFGNTLKSMLMVPPEDRAKVREQGEALAKRIDPSVDWSGMDNIQEGSKGEMTIPLPGGGALKGPDAVKLSQFGHMIGANPQLAQDMDFLGTMAKNGVEFTPPKEGTFEQQAYTEWAKANPGKSRLDFLKEKRENTYITTPNFEEKTYSDWKKMPGNENKNRFEYQKERETNRILGRTGGEELNDFTLAIEGEKYYRTGKMPSMGMGNANLRIKILNAGAEAARRDGVNPKNVPALQAEYTATVKAYEATKKPLANFQAFENAMIRNAEYAQDLSSKYSRTNYPTPNKILNAFKTQTGDKDIVEFSNAIYAASLEYEKIRTAGTNISSAELSVGAQKKAEELMNTAQSHAQLQSAIKAMKTDAKNVIESRREQLNELGKELRGLNKTFGEKQEKDDDPLGIR